MKDIFDKQHKKGCGLFSPSDLFIFLLYFDPPFLNYFSLMINVIFSLLVVVFLRAEILSEKRGRGKSRLGIIRVRLPVKI